MTSGAGHSLFNQGVADLLKRVECRRADSVADMEAVYRLRYRSYRREGSIAERLDERFEDSFDHMPNSWTFCVHIDGVLASSLRLSIASTLNPTIPAVDVFGDIIGPILAAGHTIVDPTRFVVDYDSAKQFTKLPYVTVRIAWLAMQFYKADVLLATVRTEHQAFYRRLFGHRQICPARPYPMLLKPISVMALNYDSTEGRRVEHRYPFFESTQREREKLFQPAVAQTSAA